MQLGYYRRNSADMTRPITMTSSASFPTIRTLQKLINRQFKNKIKLINKIVINQVNDHGLRPWANTADQGPVTGPKRNYLINNIIL